MEMGGTEKQDELGERGSIGFLYLNIGLQNGVLLRTVLDPVTGTCLTPALGTWGLVL